MPEDRYAENACELSSFVAVLPRLADALKAGAAFRIEIGGEA